MLRRRVAVAFVLVSLAAACSRAPGAVGGPAQPPPPSLLGVVSLSSLGDVMTAVGGYMNSVQPGTGAMLKEEMVVGAVAGIVGADGLDGADLKKPVHLLILDPKKREKPFVALVAVKDAKKLKRDRGDATVRVQGDWALVGAKASVELLAGYAFTNLAREKPAPGLRAVWHVEPLMKAFRADIEEFNRQMVSTMATQPGGANVSGILEAEIDLFLALADQSDRLEASLDITSDNVDLDIALVPRADTPFAEFVKLQKPSGHPLIARLPAVSSDMVMVGRFDAGPLRAPMIALVEKFLAGQTGKPLDPAWRAGLEKYLDLFTGEMAAVMVTPEDGRLRMVELFTVTDAAATMTATRDFLAPFATTPLTVELMGMKYTLSAKVDDSAVPGVPGSSFTMTFDFGAMDPNQADLVKRMYGDGFTVYVSVWDDVLGVTFGPDGPAAMATLVEASRGGASALRPRPALVSALERSRGRKESLLMFMNLIALMRASFPAAAALPPAESGFSMGIGFAGGAAHLRFGVPAAHVIELTRLFGAR